MEIMEDFLEGDRDKSEGLGSKLTSIIAIAGLGLGVFFLSPIVTGNAVSSLNQTNSNWIGGILFLVGLVGAFTYFRKR